jgi:repressor of nif and glnA expression
MKFIDPRKISAILRTLRTAERPLGGTRLARELRALGLDLQPRTLRLYLERLERDGLVQQTGHLGRVLTPLGVARLKETPIIDRLGMSAARADALAYRSTYRLGSAAGTVVYNATRLEVRHARAALDEMHAVFRSGLGMGRFLASYRAGERFGQNHVPEGQVLFATICSITLNGVLLHEGIPVTLRFGGVLEVKDYRPVRFTDVMYYDGTSLDPLAVFIRGGLTSVAQAARTGAGRIGASFREVPSAALNDIERIAKRLDRVGLNGILTIGRPNQPLLDFPVAEGRTGVVVAGGLNPFAALVEAGIPTETSAMDDVVPLESFRPYDAVQPVSM